MAEIANEKAFDSGSSQDASSQQAEILERPTGLKGFYYHPLTQVSMLGLVCFMGPGLFNALNGLGAGGQVSSTTSANANATLYATFSFAAFFAGCVKLYFPVLFQISFVLYSGLLTIWCGEIITSNKDRGITNPLSSLALGSLSF
jgi:hypothetical protein